MTTSQNLWHDGDGLAGKSAPAKGRGRSGEKSAEVLTLGPLILWPSRRETTLDGEDLQLTMREFDLLEFFHALTR